MSGTEPQTGGRFIGAATLLGLALGLTILSWVVASGNFRVVDPGHDPRLDEIFASIEGDEARRMATRYVASESNRAMFLALGPLQFGAILVAALLLLGPARQGSAGRLRWLRRLACVLLVVSLISMLLVSPMVDLGREIDFLSRQDEIPQQVRRFARLHGGYMLAEALKLTLLVTIPLLMLKGGSSAGGAAVSR